MVFEPADLGIGEIMSSKAIHTRGPSADEAILHGQKNVTTAGTAEALVSSSTPCEWVTVVAKRTNTGRVYVGGASVPNDDTGGAYLSAGDSIDIDVTNLIKLYINSTVNGEGVTYIYSR